MGSGRRRRITGWTMAGSLVVNASTACSGVIRAKSTIHNYSIAERPRQRRGAGVRTNQSLDLGVAHACDGLLTPATERSICPSLPLPLSSFVPDAPSGAGARCIRCFPAPCVCPFSTRCLPDPPPLFLSCHSHVPAASPDLLAQAIPYACIAVKTTRYRGGIPCPQPEMCVVDPATIYIPASSPPESSFVGSQQRCVILLAAAAAAGVNWWYGAAGLVNRGIISDP